MYFSHPSTLILFDTRQKEEYLIEMTRLLIVDFFQSLTMTLVWVLNGGRGTILDVRSKVVRFIRNGDKNWYDPRGIAAAKTTMRKINNKARRSIINAYEQERQEEEEQHKEVFR